MLWVYCSKSLFALEIELENFLSQFRGEKIIHLKRVDFETIKNQLTQINLFEEYSHFIFEDYIGSFSELSNLFERVSISSNVLITKYCDNKTYLPDKLMDKLEDKIYWLFEPSYVFKERYLMKLLEKFKIKSLPNHLLEIIKKESLNSHIQLKGVLTQLKLELDQNQEITKELIINLIKSNDVVPNLKHKYLFLEWYLSGKIKNWVLFLNSLNTKRVNAEDNLMEFLKYFSYSLNFHFWNERHTLKTQEFIRELSYNFFIFIEQEIFKIKSSLFSGVVYFFWKNRPLINLQLNIY
ncbi:hypothetical protein OVS_03070 [Mycoplasma ovis str. Michigan]|uniref:DNA polymerase III subunit delta n=1 Tax=Mycoplasma ovis str. Michigan TaxID=1415773 RepID=A0ABN4BQS7_9MOLU|nr:hypothetical protein [Mycoplasma ovis]AHC40029.1 hypothetical protein OVS_03070 [Mycoplasma ovis str. Michigan]